MWAVVPFCRTHCGIFAVLFFTAACGDDSNNPSSSTTDGETTLSGAGSPANGGNGSGASSSQGGGGNGAGAGGVGGAGGAAGGSSADGGGGSGSGGGSGEVLRFVAFGDAGKGNQGQQDVANAIATKCAADGCDFVQLLGDNIYDSGVDSTTDDQWQSKFEVPYAAIDLPFWVVLGNHDYGGNGAGYEFGKGQNEVDYTNVSTKWKLPSAYWHRTQANVEFFALDTNMAMYNQADDQASDFPTWIAQSTATWKIALGHHPYYSNGPHGNAGEYDGLPFVPITNGAGVKEILEEAICGQVDIYISGHDHSMQWLQSTCSGTELIVSGAGASTTELGGDNQSYFESVAEGFLYVRIQGNSFTGEFIDTAGTVLYSRTITK